ncbi:MAG: hypothetical protein A3I44_04680 [Candidatus Sungbacteria bacterium RIFCSPLOWO2_02_FULL_51_17]|nr:MAG: hypothetical protein A2676_05405 [Candidatus Sungbacteria bacterium RIFCSPHIGHO2_01_FULL_51_22]OHA07911.1 MAG: hypothetical protein A3B29_05005 [Candidatus Sungbacteria bacterium RIFCSPLOWO2_01_FULL_51_34]OHA12465.1 MAG: hypothetical protein A3I44_04680 [Candidatus Sungbacteria bacterium RIFCSPLOWO2_02_FULL_51_17]
MLTRNEGYNPDRETVGAFKAESSRAEMIKGAIRAITAGAAIALSSAGFDGEEFPQKLTEMLKEAGYIK